MSRTSLCQPRSLVGLVLLLLATPAAGLPESQRHRVVWTQYPAYIATIGWDQVSGEDPVLYFDTTDYGTDLRRYNFFSVPHRREEYFGMDSCFVELIHLPPDTEVYFVVADSEGVSRRMWFRTAPDVAKPFTFVAGGDTKSYGKAREIGRIGNRIVAKVRPLFVLYAGDFASGSLRIAEEWRQWLDDWSADTISPDGRVYPIVPVRGNHEPDPQILYRLFALPEPESYFAFDVGGELLRVYALNSEINIIPESGLERGSDSDGMRAQTDWLANDLSENGERRFKIAGYHKPIRPHTARKPENDYLYPWAGLFHEHRVSIALQGDSHLHAVTWPVRPAETDEAGMGFVRDDETGTMYVGEGSWGAGRRAADDDKPWTMVSASIQQIKWIHVHPDHLEIRTLVYDADTDPGAIEAVEDADPLKVPKGLKLYDDPTHGTVIRYPVKADD